MTLWNKDEFLGIEKGMSEIFPELGAGHPGVGLNGAEFGEAGGGCDEALAFVVVREAAEGGFEHGIEAVVNGRVVSADELGGPVAGLLEDEWIVEQGEGLGWDIGNIAPALADFAAGNIKGAEEFGALHEIDLDIDAAPSAAVERAGEEAAVGVILVAIGGDTHAEHGAIE